MFLSLLAVFSSYVSFVAVESAEAIVPNQYPQCYHNLFQVSVLKLSPEDNNYSEKDITENGTVCVCNFRSCFLKCCPDGFVSSKSDPRTCVGSDKPFSLSNFLGGPFNNDYSLSSGFPCDQSFWDTDYEALLPNGSLISSDGLLQPGEFCLEFSETQDRYLPLCCFFSDLFITDNDDEKYAFYPIGMLISIPFFIATFVVYAIIPEFRGTIHGMSFMSHIAIVIVGYSVLAAIQLDAPFGSDFSMTTCITLAYIMQFAFLATFFWMNVMCFDIWWTFSSLKKPNGSVRERDLKKFLLYSIYAWGFPLLILTATLIADFTPLLPANSQFRPDMGVSKCFFATTAATWLYIYGPIAILIVANLVMFGFTAKKIFMHTRETQVLKSEDSKRHDSKDRERFNLYFKLFIVMGVNWVAELISWAFPESKVFYITDITNTLQGFFIFVIFVCKRRVLRLLEAAVCPSRAARRNAQNSSSRSRNTTTSVINGSARAHQTPETVQLKAAAALDSDSNM